MNEQREKKNEGNEKQRRKENGGKRTKNKIFYERIEGR